MRLISCIVIVAATGAGVCLFAGANAPATRPAARPPASGPAAGLKTATVMVSHDAAVDVFTITNQVQVKDPPRFGVNVGCSVFKPWGNDQRLNIWNSDASFEPIVMRHSHLLFGGGEYGPDFIEEGWIGGDAEHRPGLSWYGSFPDKVWNGAELRIYRADGAEGYKLIHKTTVKNYRCHADRSKALKDDARMDFDTLMPAALAPCREDDFIVLTHVVNQVPVPDDKRFAEMKNGFMTVANGATQVIDPSTHCPEGGSTASMKITLPGSEAPAGIAHPYLRAVKDPKDLGWQKLLKDQPYKCQIWMKQEGLANGEVTVQLSSLVTKTLKVTGEWTQYEFDVPNDPARLTDQPTPLLVGSTDKGTLWVDNFLVYQANWPPFRMLKGRLETLKAWKPGTLRIWTPLYAQTLECALSQKFAEMNRWSTRRLEGTTGFSIPQALELCEEVGADPWLTLYPGYDDEECARLMEYLCAPADVGYGKRRAADGHPKPWSEVFGKIYFECGNECWNGTFAPLAYPGKPKQYGQIANHLFGRIKASPYFKEGRFLTVANGWSGSIYRQRDSRTGQPMMAPDKKRWCLEVAENCPKADVVDLAFYYGGADGLTVLGADDKALYTSQLMYSARVVEPGLEDAKLLAKEIKDQSGRDVRFAVYEGGPGYAIPGPGKAFVEVSEEVGKSLAMGVLTLDAYMYNLADGYVSNNYFTLKSGYNWATFKEDNDPVPYPSWQALGLRNVYCTGDLVKVEPSDVKRVDYSEEVAEKLNWKGDQKVKRTIPARAGIPLSLCYAFKDGKKRCILLINRTYDEPRQVRLSLPYEPSGRATVYTLTHADPRAHNRFQENVKIQSQTRDDFANGFTITVPPSSALVLVNQGK